jgi:hypothetical protein
VDSGNELRNVSEMGASLVAQGSLGKHILSFQKCVVTWLLVGVWLYLGAFILYSTEYDRELNTANDVKQKMGFAVSMLGPAELKPLQRLMADRLSNGLCSFPDPSTCCETN